MPTTPPEPSVDDYMARLARELKSLPAAVRDEHLRELRQHVEQLIAARAGQPDAVQSALLQMGDPAQVGQNLVREWQRQNRVFWQTVIAVAVGWTLLNALMMPASSGTWLFRIYHMVDGTNGRNLASLYNILALLPPVLAGLVIGRRLPERAISAAIAVGLIASLCNNVSFFYNMHSSLYGFTLPGLGVSGYELLAAYIASSVKRREWTLRLQ